MLRSRLPSWLGVGRGLSRFVLTCPWSALSGIVPWRLTILEFSGAPPLARPLQRGVRRQVIAVPVNLLKRWCGLDWSHEHRRLDGPFRDPAVECVLHLAIFWGSAAFRLFVRTVCLVSSGRKEVGRLARG